MIRGAASVFGALSLAAALVPTGTIAAQSKPGDDVPRLMVVPFRGNEKALGPQASEAVRVRIASDVSVKQLAVIAKSTVCANLEASGFSCDSVPDALTARLLANSLRTEEYLEGSIVKTGNAYKLDSRYYVTGFIDMAQPLPPANGTKLGDLAEQVSKAFMASRKQVPDFTKCMHAVRAGTYAEAITAAQTAITIYPNSTIARICLANALLKQDSTRSDTIIAVSSKVIAIDPRNKLALGMIAEEYRKRGVAFRAAGQNDSARAYLTKAVEAWADLIAADPKNVQLVQDIVNKIGQTGYAVAAKPIITKAVDDNPGDPDLIKLKWQILLATRDTADLREAVRIGDEMVKVDTSAADTTFFIRQAAAYAQLGDVQKAAATTSAGINKFPLNQSIWALNAQVQRLAGNPQAALDASQKLVQLDPANGHYYLLMAQAQIDLQRPDPAVQSIRLALKPPGAPRAASAAAKEDSVLAGKLLLVLGNQAYKAAGAANPQRRDDYKRAVSLLSFADSVAPTPQAKFVKGVAAFKAGDMAVRENQTAKRCDLAHEAQDYFTIAQINVAAGGSVDPKTAGQILSILSQYGPSVDGQLKKFCK
jgi:tetratricopeptide (TPR) repeat protein